MTDNFLSLLLIEKAASQKKAEQDKNTKQKKKKYSTQRFENKIGLDPVTVSFIKRTNGDRRIMNLIRNWEGLNEYQDEFNFKPSKGKSANGIDYEKNNLSLVWDLDKQDYRMVNCDTVSSVKPYRPRKKNNELYKLLKKIQTNK